MYFTVVEVDKQSKTIIDGIYLEVIQYRTTKHSQKESKRLLACVVIKLYLLVRLFLFFRFTCYSVVPSDIVIYWLSSQQWESGRYLLQKDSEKCNCGTERKGLLSPAQGLCKFCLQRICVRYCRNEAIDWNQVVA